MYSKIFSANSVLANKLITIILILTTTASHSFAKQTDDSILNAVSDSCVGVYASFKSNANERNTFQMVASLISAAGLTGVLNTNQQIIADAAYVTIKLSKFPHTIFIENLYVKQIGDRSFALKSFSGGIIIKAPKSQHTEFLLLLKKIIDHYFTSSDAKIVWIGKDKYRHQKLTADTLPKWANWQWISLNDYFLFTIGSDAFDAAIKTLNRQRPSFTSVRLVKLANENDTDIKNRIWLGYIDVVKLRTMLGPTMKASLDNIINALDASDLQRWLLTAGFTKRAFISKVYLQWRDRTEMGYLTDRLFPSNPLYKAIPPQAKSYGVSYIDVSGGMNSIINTYLQSRNPVKREKLIRNYNKIMKRAGLENTEKLIFRHLGPMMIVHDWPAHPLNWPFAKTFLIQHDGSPELMENWNKILPVWQMLMRKISNNDRLKNMPVDVSSLFSLQLDKTDDGIWFVHIGPLVLAAAGLQNKFLVISHSVLAVRVNIQYLNSVFPPTATTSKPTTAKTHPPAFE